MWRQRWTNTEEQESKQGTDTPSLLKVIAAYYLYLELSVLHSIVRVAHEDAKRNNHSGTKKKQCRDGFLRKASRWWQRPLSEVENTSGSRDRLKCPTRRTARERKASAATVTEMSRKMEAVQRRQEERLRRLHQEASARVVREEADADVEVCWCYAAFLAAPSGAAPLCSAAAAGRSSRGWKRPFLDRCKLCRSTTTWGLVRIKWMDSGHGWLCAPASSTALRSVLVRGYRPTAAVCYDTRRGEGQAKSLNTTEARRSSRAEERPVH